MSEPENVTKISGRLTRDFQVPSVDCKIYIVTNSCRDISLSETWLVVDKCVLSCENIV